MSLQSSLTSTQVTITATESVEENSYLLQLELCDVESEDQATLRTDKIVIFVRPMTISAK